MIVIVPWESRSEKGGSFIAARNRFDVKYEIFEDSCILIHDDDIDDNDAVVVDDDDTNDDIE